MCAQLSVTVKMPLRTTPQRVWKALTDPAEIKQYMFGTTVVSDWQKGSTISYSGVWNGKPYTDKGTIVDIVPEKLLHTKYFSPLSGKEDIPENYAHVNYDLLTEEGDTVLVITQDNIDDEATRGHMEQNWKTMLNTLKQLIEAN